MLKASHDGIAKAGKPMGRAAEHVNFVPDAVVAAVPLDEKSLLAALEMPRQSAVGKAKPLDRAVAIMNDIYNSSDVQCP